MTKTTFSNGTIVTAAFLNAINNPVFVDNPDDDGEIAKLTNSALSTASGQLLPEWQGFRDALAVTAGIGLNANYAAGVVTLPTGVRQSIVAGTVSLPASSTSYIFVNASGTVASSTSYPTLGLILASVLTTASQVSTVTDLRPRYEVKPIQEFVKILGGTGGEGAFSPVANQTLSAGLYYFSSFTVPSGVTVTIDKFARIFVSGNVEINGTITVTPAAVAASSFLSNVNDGGFSGFTGSGLGNNRGVYNFAVQPFGSAGQNGVLGTQAGFSGLGKPGAGGPGGGGLWIEAAGSIVVGSTGIVSADGGNGGNAELSPSATGLAASGGGGGSGGTLVFSSGTSVVISSGAVVRARGGNGGSPVNGWTPAIINSGGGGGAGQLVVIAPTINIVATPQLTGGSPVSNSATGGYTNGTLSATSPNIGGGWGGGNGGAGGDGSTIVPGGTFVATGVNAQPGSIAAVIARNFKAVG
jgi:hypothetical protein